MKNWYRFNLLDLFVLTLLVSASIFVPALVKQLIPARSHSSWDRSQVILFLITLYAVVFTLSCEIRILVAKLWRVENDRLSTHIILVGICCMLLVACRHLLLGLVIYPLGYASYTTVSDCIRWQTMFALESMPAFCAAGMGGVWIVYRWLGKKSNELKPGLFDYFVRFCVVFWFVIWLGGPFLHWLPIPGLRTAGIPW